jgi:hypothetical protein
LALAKPQGQGAFNPAPQGGLPTDMGDYLYGPGDPTTAPPASSSFDGRPQGPGASPTFANGTFGPAATNADLAALGPENAAALASLLAKPAPQAAPRNLSEHVLLAQALMNLAPAASKDRAQMLNAPRLSIG